MESVPVFNPQYLSVKVDDILKALPIGHRVHEEKPVSFPHVLLSHRTELLLTGRVQNYNKRELTIRTVTWTDRA